MVIEDLYIAIGELYMANRVAKDELAKKDEMNNRLLEEVADLQQRIDSEQEAGT